LGAASSWQPWLLDGNGQLIRPQRKVEKGVGERIQKKEREKKPFPIGQRASFVSAASA